MILEVLVPFLFSCIILAISSSLIIKLIYRDIIHSKSNHSVALVLTPLLVSLPELFIGIIAGAFHAPELSLGNVIGTNILNLTLIIGVTILLSRNSHFEQMNIKKSLVSLMLVCVIPLILIMDRFFLGIFNIHPDGNFLSRIDGLILISIFLLIYYLKIKKGIKLGTQNIPKFSIDSVRNSFLIVCSLILAFFSSFYVVDYAIKMSNATNLPFLMTGMLVVALGTSLPQVFLETGKSSFFHEKILFSDLIGSIIANITLVLGITALISPIKADLVIYLANMLFLIFCSLIVFSFASHGKKFTWKEGLSLLGLYLIYVVLQLSFKISVA